MEAAAAAAEQQKQQELTEKPPPSSATVGGAATAAHSTHKPHAAIKHRKRRTKNKALNGDAHHELQIDVKRPNSVLVDTSIRALLTGLAFARLSPDNQKILIESLPLVDRPSTNADNEPLALNPSSINNEFFNRACIEWRDRLAYGEFTNEHQTKLRAEQEREKSKIDPWKARNFEGIWGIKSAGPRDNLGQMLEKSALEVKQLEQGDFEIPAVYIDEVWKSEGEVEGEGEEGEGEGEEKPESAKHEHEEDDDDDDDDDEVEEEEEEEEEDDDEEEDMPPRSVPTPPETVTSTQPDASDSPSPPHAKSPSPPSPQPPQLHAPVIAEATSSADSPQPSTSSNFIADDDDDIASHVELSSDGMPTQWYHRHEHDYLKTPPDLDVPESSGMDEIVDDTGGIELVDNDNAVEGVPAVTRLANYDAELPHDIFHRTEPPPPPVSVAVSGTGGGMLINSFVQHQQQQQQQLQQPPPPPVMVIENPPPTTTTTTTTSTVTAVAATPRYNQVMVQEEPLESSYHDAYMMDESDLEPQNSFQDEIHVNMPKNVKLLAFPSGVNYINNDKYIIEEQPQTQHIPQQSTSTFRTANGANIQSLQSSYFVGGTNTFTYISKMGGKLEPTDSTARIVKQESNNNQTAQVKQRIIYEISTEPKITYEQPTHHVATYAAAPPQPEIFHKMVNHNGTTTIYTESTGPPQKKTIIQRKKPNDPYTVQVALQSVANNNTIILTPIGNASAQPVSQQPPKSIVHIHRAAPLQPPVQFLTAAPTPTFLKKQTVIIPSPSAPPKYTTVIRAPAPQLIQPATVTAAAPSKIQRPIQKQKVIMSTSSLQQYRSYSQKPTAHGSRKQLHPQHIIRPAPSASVAATVIHHQPPPADNNNKSNAIPVQILPGTSAASTFADAFAPLPSSAAPTVVTINSAPTKSIFVRQSRPTQIFQPQPHGQQLFASPPPTAMVQTQHGQLVPQPRMRHINAHRPPPGNVNLERSYQICQAVIQNSPNRHQLNCQLKPPPAALMSGASGGGGVGGVGAMGGGGGNAAGLGQKKF